MKPKYLFLYSNDIELDYFLDLSGVMQKQFIEEQYFFHNDGLIIYDHYELLVRKIDIDKTSRIQDLLGVRLAKVTLSLELYNEIIEYDKQLICDVLEPMLSHWSCIGSDIVHIFDYSYIGWVDNNERLVKNYVDEEKAISIDCILWRYIK